MKLLSFLVLLLTFQIIHAQVLPIDFESEVTTEDLVDFDGGTGTVIDNPFQNDDNPSSKVAQIVRDGGAIWSGSKIILDTNLDFTTMNGISMNVYSSAPIGTVVKFKLEGGGAIERDVVTTKSNEWETLTWDFTATPTIFNEVVFMFDFGNVGDGGTTSTFLFDDVTQLFGGKQIDLPVSFEEEDVNYSVTDFGGNQSMLSIDPTNENNMVVQVVKTGEAATWAGTTIGTPAGFATNIPLSLTDSKMNVRVWSPEANTPIRLKVEDSNDPTHTCETETNSTVDGGWEVIEFDFLNQAPGTELLSVGLDKGWTYNMASIFFNFGTDGFGAGEKTYYFDDVQFGPQIVGLLEFQKIEAIVFPNPTIDLWTIELEDVDVISFEVYDVEGHMLSSSIVNTNIISIDGNFLESGIYFAKVNTKNSYSYIKLIKQ